MCPPITSMPAVSGSSSNSPRILAVSNTTYSADSSRCARAYSPPEKAKQHFPVSATEALNKESGAAEAVTNRMPDAPASRKPHTLRILGRIHFLRRGSALGSFDKLDCCAEEFFGVEVGVVAVVVWPKTGAVLCHRQTRLVRSGE